MPKYKAKDKAKGQKAGANKKTRKPIVRLCSKCLVCFCCIECLPGWTKSRYYYPKHFCRRFQLTPKLKLISSNNTIQRPN